MSKMREMIEAELKAKHDTFTFHTDIIVSMQQARHVIAMLLSGKWTRWNTPGATPLTIADMTRGRAAGRVIGLEPV